MDHKKNFLSGMHDGIPIALGYFAVSFTLGIACRNIGLSAVESTVMSLTNLTSAGEFAALNIIVAGAGYWEMALSQLVINLRYMLMSASLSQKLAPDTPLYHRLMVGYGVTDEIFGISINVPGRLDPFYTYGAVAIASPAWALGTCLGVVLGNVLPARIVVALSVALYGMFLAIIIPPAKKDKILALLVLVSMAASWAFPLVPFFAGISGGMKIIILTVAISAIAAVLFPVHEEKGEAAKPEDSAEACHE
ncbi:MAG: AzlC family ABC transporter permease [Mailhella sp.]|nr:AzlC family ABC transporter permease [Mailhella sp.]